jgi:hypothetical protein
MAADRARIAAALAREEQRRRLMESVPSTERVAPAPQSRNLRRDLENLSIGVGEGITNQLEGLKGIVTDPIGSAKAGYEAIRGIVRDPSVLADALRYTAQKAGSGPLGAGEVIGEMVSPMRGKAPVMAEIDVYHGSPHRFEAFDASKIGTGEGAQAYGHGIYLAESPDVAKTYKAANDPIARKAEELLRSTDGDVDRAMRYARKKVEDLEKNRNVKGFFSPVALEQNQGALNYLQQVKKGKTPQVGTMYTADLPDEMVDRMLDWDKPLSEQPEAVRNALKRRITDVRPTDGFDMGGNAKLRDNRKGQIDKTSSSPWLLETVSGNGMSRFGLTQKDVDRMFGSKDVAEITGNQILSRLTEQMGSQAKASEYLRSLGIPGIKYLDAGSRGQGGTGTRNFVVFPGEEKKVKILKRE